jgi:beta-glucosidase
MTFPRAENETPANTPAQYPGVDGTATYSERLEVGYRWYDAHGVPALFPFGHGLSYTTFSLANLNVPETIHSGTAVSVSVDVTDTGSRSGSQVVQVYVAAPAAAGEPPKQLKGFAKVSLSAGQTKRVTVPLDPRAFGVWDTATDRWVDVPGTYRVLVGDSARSLPLSATLTLTP